MRSPKNHTIGLSMLCVLLLLFTSLALLPTFATALTPTEATPEATATTTVSSAILHEDPLPTPQWGRTDCTAPFTDCAQIRTYRDWSVRNKDLVSFYVERAVADPVGAVTVWLVSDTHSNIALVTELVKTGVNVVRFHPRGGQRADPRLVCGEDAVSSGKNCWPDATCAQQLRNKGMRLEQFAIPHVARDLQWVLSSLGRGTHNVILAEGLSAAIVTHYLTLFPNEATSDLGVLFVDPVYPGRRDGEAYSALSSFYQHVDAAAQHLLSLCDAQPLCLARLGAQGSAWRRLQNVLQAIAAGSLPCIKDKKLQWATASGSNDPDRAVRETLAALVSPYQFFAPSDAALLQLVPSFLYRLQRCNEGDVRALNHLRDYLQGGAHVSECPANTPLYMNWLSNEFQNRSKRESASSGSSQSILDAALKELDLTLVPGHLDMTSFLHFDETVAHYSGEDHIWKDAYQGTPQVLLLTSDMDSVFAPGSSAKLALHFNAITAHQVRGGGAAHLPANTGMRTCLVNHLRQYSRSFTWGEQELCNPGATKDFDFVQVVATPFYGVADAWEFSKPYPDEPTGGRSRSDDDDAPKSVKTYLRVLGLIVAGACGLALLGAALYYGRQWYLHRRYEQLESDNFFDYLQ